MEIPTHSSNGPKKRSEKKQSKCKQHTIINKNGPFVDKQGISTDDPSYSYPKTDNENK